MNRQGIKHLQQYLLFLSITFLLGCTTATNPPAPEARESTSPTQTTEATQESRESTTSKEPSLDKPGDSLENEAGKATLVKIHRPNATVESGPMKLTIKTVALTEWEPTLEMAKLVGKEGRFTLASVAVEVENTSQETIAFYPDQATLVAKKEQSQANLILTEPVGGDFIGQVIKKGKIAFVLDTPAQEIELVKMVINAPHNQKFEKVGDQLTLEYPVSE